MTDPRIQRALISVYDKTGIVDFARRLAARGVDIISTGGTAEVLTNAGIAVRLVEDITGSPELFDGRVKTLHPAIHGAILADRGNPRHRGQLRDQGMAPIDLVVVNLYPFSQTIAREGCTAAHAIEMIDIGGPCLLRAAAKNHAHVLAVSDPADYGCVADFLEHPETGSAWAELCRDGAARAFELTAAYDAAVASWLADRDDLRVMRFRRRAQLRYGENPHQTAELWSTIGPACGPDLTRSAAAGAGVTMSYNNYADAHAALGLCCELSREMPVDQAACCFIKHGNPCGCAVDADPLEAYRKAYLGDPAAAMGGILATNVAVTAEFARAVAESLRQWGTAAGAAAFFLEVWLAPGFDPSALEVLQRHGSWGARVRCLSTGPLQEPLPDTLELRSVSGGALVQTPDGVGLDERGWRVVSRRPPQPAEYADLRLAWLICKHTRSNAVTLCKDGMLLGNGAGQMSRIMSCRVACWLARDSGHADQLAGCTAASDAFFPFRDGPDLLIASGVRALIQPGGSKRDAETIAACDDHDVTMIMTGTRHFKH